MIYYILDTLEVIFAGLCLGIVINLVRRFLFKNRR
jgi:hypothetical protein